MCLDVFIRTGNLCGCEVERQDLTGSVSALGKKKLERRLKHPQVDLSLTAASLSKKIYITRNCIELCLVINL